MSFKDLFLEEITKISPDNIKCYWADFELKQKIFRQLNKETNMFLERRLTENQESNIDINREVYLAIQTCLNKAKSIVWDEYSLSYFESALAPLNPEDGFDYSELFFGTKNEIFITSEKASVKIIFVHGLPSVKQIKVGSEEYDPDNSQIKLGGRSIDYVNRHPQFKNFSNYIGELYLKSLENVLSRIVVDQYCERHCSHYNQQFYIISSDDSRIEGRFDNHRETLVIETVNGIKAVDSGENYNRICKDIYNIFAKDGTKVRTIDEITETLEADSGL